VQENFIRFTVPLSTLLGIIMELVTVTLTVPRQYLPSLYRVCADLNSKANDQENGKKKDRHRNRPGNIAKTTMKSVKDLTMLSRKTSDPDVKRVLVAAVEKLTSDVASSISATEKVDKWLDVADAVVEEQQLVEAAKVAVVVGRAQDIVQRQELTQAKVLRTTNHGYGTPTHVVTSEPTNGPTIQEWSTVRSDRRTRQKPQKSIEHRPKRLPSKPVIIEELPPTCEHRRFKTEYHSVPGFSKLQKANKCLDCSLVSY